MRIPVLFFGQLKEINGLAQEEAELSDGAKVDDLFERYGRRFPKLAEFRGSIATSVNQEYADWRQPLETGDEVAFLPPVSGGGRWRTPTTFSCWCANASIPKRWWPS